MAEQVQGLDPINYGMGTGWLDYYNLMSQMLTQQGAAQGSVGTSVLDQLTKLITSPTSGPLGLAATAAYGNPQGIAEATGGKGFDNSEYTGRYQQVLDDLIGYTSNINKKASDIPLVDPNNAPAMTPENAAKAPNTANDLIEAYKAYHGGQRPPGLALGGIVEKMLPPIEKKKVPGATDGEKFKTPTPSASGPTAQPHPTPPRTGTITAPSLEGSAGNQDAYAAFGGKDLVDAMTKYTSEGGNPAKFIQTVQAIGKLSDLVKEGKVPVPGQVPHPGAPPVELANAGANIINQMLSQYGSQVGLARGGGVTLAGQPHWIVDDKGTPVAAITEDGAPEHVGGTPDGAVEVTPLKPDRYEAYTGKSAEGEEWGRMLAQMGASMPGAATGQKLLFPDIPNSQVDTSPEPGTNQIPSHGGPSSAPANRGYGAGTAPKSIDDLFGVVNSAPGSDLNSRYASLLGGALSGNTTLANERGSLNAGLAPNKLFSAQQLSTMSPSQRSAYASMLQQMGIIASPEDLAYYVKQFTPDGLG